MSYVIMATKKVTIIRNEKVTIKAPYTQKYLQDENHGDERIFCLQPVRRSLSDKVKQSNERKAWSLTLFYVLT